MVAILGTTISPYLFFWQAGQEVEELHRRHVKALCIAPRDAGPELARIRTDTIVGMGISNLIALFIIFATAATLNANGVTDIQTSSQAAEALRPIAGVFTFALFAAGIIATGMLAVPVLAGSAAYGVSEVFGWTEGLDRRPREAKVILRHDCGRDARRGCAELHIARSGQGALLERRRQRRARRAADGRHDGDRNEPAHHGPADAAAPDARGRMAGDIGHGARNNRVLLDLISGSRCFATPRRDRHILQHHRRCRGVGNRDVIVAVRLGHRAGKRAAHRHPVEKFHALGAGLFDELRDGVTR